MFWHYRFIYYIVVLLLAMTIFKKVYITCGYYNTEWEHIYVYGGITLYSRCLYEKANNIKTLNNRSMRCNRMIYIK